VVHPITARQKKGEKEEKEEEKNAFNIIIK